MLIPARNEERNICRCLDSLLQQTYQDYEILELDDQSTDRTWPILSRYAQDHPDRVQAVLGKPLPEACWNGKAHAMHQLAHLARGEYLLFTDADTVHSSDSISWAASHYEKGLAYIERVPECDVFSEGWRMRSEHIGQLCLVKGLGFLLANGRKVVGCAAQALELDPANAAAQIIVAASKVYPPALFGGNPAIGIELMQKALAMGTAERDDLFNIYSGIGLAYGKLKNSEEARCWLEKALELYPGNLFVRGEYWKLGNQGK